MTDPTPVDDISVVGQRRRTSAGSFPPSGGGGSSGSGGIHQNEVGMEPPPPPMPVSHPCDDPETAEEWNIDAAAAKAAKEFARLAAERTPPETLNNREWGCYIYREADGSIHLGPITWGDPFQSGGVGSVTPSHEGLNPVNIVGSVHSHSSGNHLPSSGHPDSPGDIQHLDGLVNFTQNDSARLYIVAQNQGPAGFTPYNQVNVYNKYTARNARDTFTPGPEVNPEAAPCPAS